MADLVQVVLLISEMHHILKIVQSFSRVVIYSPRMSLDLCGKSSLQRVQIQIVNMACVATFAC